MQGVWRKESDFIWFMRQRDARERSDIDIAVSGVDNMDALIEKVEELPTLYSVDLLNMDTCRNNLLLEDIKQYGREI